MNKEAFISKMKKDRKSVTTIKRNIQFAQNFENYLKGEKRIQLENAKPADLEAFKSWGEKNRIKNLRMHFWSIASYFSCIDNQKMVLKAKELMGLLDLDKYKLNEFRGVDRKWVERLGKEQIKTAGQILAAGQTREGRKKLSKKTRIPVASILELVKLSDLARIPGVKKIRARLYHDAGLDTLEKIAACKADELRDISAKYIQHSGFDGIPPAPKEAENTVMVARYLAKRVEY